MFWWEDHLFIWNKTAELSITNENQYIYLAGLKGDWQVKQKLTGETSRIATP